MGRRYKAAGVELVLNANTSLFPVSLSRHTKPTSRAGSCAAAVLGRLGPLPMAPHAASAAALERELRHPWLRFFDPYYTGNVALLLVYGLIRRDGGRERESRPAARLRPSPPLSRPCPPRCRHVVARRAWFVAHGTARWSLVFDRPDDLFPLERNALAVATVASLVKTVRRQSADGAVASAFLYFKSAACLLLFCCDVRLWGQWCMLAMVHLVLTRQPLYRGPSRVGELSNLDLSRDVESSDRADPDVYHLVCFFTLWHPACVALEPVLADLSVRYGTPGLRFWRLDVTRYPGAATRHGVAVGGTTRQLPTLVLFRGGEELGRIPHVYPDGTVAKGVFRRAAIETGFDLERISTETRGHVPQRARKADQAGLTTPAQMAMYKKKE